MKSCTMCLFAGTNNHCEGCLGKSKVFEYNNYQKGNFKARLLWLEITGQKNFVIGGTGEAEVNVNQEPTQSLKELYEISMACGYMTHSLKPSKQGNVVAFITTPEGVFKLFWNKEKLIQINSLNWDTKGNILKNFDVIWSRKVIEKYLQKCKTSGDPLTANFEIS
jgi:hypothetical protein